MPGIEFKALYMLGRHSATELPPQSFPHQTQTYLFWDRVHLNISGWPCIPYVGKILEMMILLPLYPYCWDCRHVPPPFLAWCVYAYMHVHMCKCVLMAIFILRFILVFKCFCLYVCASGACSAQGDQKRKFYSPELSYTQLWTLSGCQ